MSFGVLLLLVLSVGAFAQEKCRAPSLMSANASLSDYDEEIKELFHGFIRINYDEDNERIAREEFFFTIPTSNRRILYTVVEDYKEKVRYSVNKQTGQCTVTKLTTEFDPIEVPSSAYLRGEAIVGVEGAVGGGVLQAYVWAGTTESGGRYAGLWTSNCLPVLDYYRSEKSWRHLNLYDVQNKVDDGAFNKPAACQ